MDPTTTGTDPARRAHRFRPTSRRWVAAAVAAAALALTGCQVPGFGAYKGSTAQGQDAYKLWQGFFIAGLVVGGLVALLILVTIVRYRRRSDEMPKQTQYHTIVEILYTAVPIVIVLVLFGFTVATENNIISVSKHPSLTVDVRAFQWGWEFDYPGQGVRPVLGAASLVNGHTVNVPDMVVPAGETVQIDLSSKDVIHGFYVPEFNYSEYAMPGYTNTFDIDVLRPGTYRGQCTQLCGLYHSEMLFNVKALPPAQFSAWLQARQQSDPGASGAIRSGPSSSSGYTSSGDD